MADTVRVSGRRVRGDVDEGDAGRPRRRGSPVSSRSGPRLGRSSRSGVGHALTPEELGGALSQGIPAFGDPIGGMNIAGGISAALFHRERTGEAAEIDVSLLSTAWWAGGASVTQGMETGETMRSVMPGSVGPTVNPFMG